MNKVSCQMGLISCLSILALGLAGCGGGGGSSTVTSVTPSRATTTELSTGISQDATYTASGTAVTGIVNLGVNKSGASTAITTYDDDGTIQKIVITTPETTVTWDDANGDIIDNTDVAVVATSASSSNIGVVINRSDSRVGWNYQTFGIWESGLGSGSGNIGAVSVGTPTTGSAIPITGSATFTGITGGVYIDAAGTTNYITASALTANVDFLNRSIGLVSAGTTKLNTATAVSSLDSTLNMTGTLTYNAGVNSFTGAVSSAGGMTGNSTGQFYGPNAEELGGVFSMTGTGVEYYSGAYGAQR